MIPAWQRCYQCGRFLDYNEAEHLYCCRHCPDWFCFDQLRHYHTQRQEARKA